MGRTALEIISGSLRDIGVLGQGETPDAAKATEGLTLLNNMVSGWRIQPGTVLCIERTIFPLVANKQTYTIGLGGDFNVPRPTRVSGAGLWLNGLAAAAAITSITRSGYTATVTQTSHPFAVGDEAYVDGADDPAYNGLQTVQSVPDADTWTYTVDGLPTSPAVGTLTAAAVEGQPTEIPRNVLTDDAYQAIQIKNLSNSQFTDVYFNPTSKPFATVVLWPRPTVASNQLVLYLDGTFSGFADLTRQYDWPDNPGYAEALQYQLDLRIAIPYGQPITPDIRSMAKKTFGDLKRSNNKVNDVATDATLLTRDRRGGYNINTGTGG